MFAPLFILIAAVRWTWLAATVIVALGLTAMTAHADEREAMDFDTCMEHQGDISEHFYQPEKGWRVTRSDDDGKTSHWIKVKGDREVHLICRDGMSIVETKPYEVKPQGQVDFLKWPKAVMGW